MKKINRFILNLQFIFRPSYWLMLYPYSEEWDRKLNKLLDEERFKEISFCTAVLGTKVIWTANHPYASFMPYINYDRIEVRPSRLTIKKARKKLFHELFGI